MKKISNQFIFYTAIILSLFAIYSFAPIVQDQDYHNFAEQRIFMGIPHVGDVISNLCFMIVGLILYIQSQFWNIKELYPKQESLFKYFCFGSIALGFGSGYYHWGPVDETLVMDRATMVLGFAVVFYDSCIRYGIIKDKYCLSGAMLTSLIFLGTVEYWEMFGRLEPYVFVQFFTMFVLVVLAIKNYKNIPSKHLFNMFVWYAVAKICENQDKQIFELTQHIVSGHTLKHVAYAVALYVFGKDMFKNR